MSKAYNHCTTLRYRKALEKEDCVENFLRGGKSLYIYTLGAIIFTVIFLTNAAKNKFETAALKAFAE